MSEQNSFVSKEQVSFLIRIRRRKKLIRYIQLLLLFIFLQLFGKIGLIKYLHMLYIVF